MSYLVAIRVRGRTGIKPDLKYTLNLLNLTRINHCAVYKNDEKNKGMLLKVKDYVAYGEISEEVFSKMVSKRGRLKGDKRVDTEFVSSVKEKDMDSLVKNLFSGKTTLTGLGIKKVFRLHPPKGGYKSTKHSYPRGSLGYMGEEVNTLLKRMI
jgi:large subunit ribosomal protein L30